MSIIIHYVKIKPAKQHHKKERHRANKGAQSGNITEIQLLLIQTRQLNVLKLTL